MVTCDNCGGKIIFNEKTQLIDCENHCGNYFALNDPDPAEQDDYDRCKVPLFASDWHDE
jgi:hypothetical protein